VFRGTPATVNVAAHEFTSQRTTIQRPSTVKAAAPNPSKDKETSEVADELNSDLIELEEEEARLEPVSTNADIGQHRK